MPLDIASLHAIFLHSTGVCTDTRRPECFDGEKTVAAKGQTPGKPLFFALKGESFDGNRYARQALDKGAGYAVVDDASVVKTGDQRYVLVDDVLTSLQELAAFHRRYLDVCVIAVTGSNGKTTTKELIGRVLSRKYDTLVTQGNLNNHIGVPLTLLQMGEKTRFAVIEMGANHQKEIERLCAVAAPDYGIITNIGKAHLEGFGGIEGIMKGKGELFDYLDAHVGGAFYLEDDEILRQMAAAHPRMKKIPYSTADMTLLDSNAEILSVCLRDKNTVIHSRLTGVYNRYNMACAVAVGEFFGVPISEIKQAVESYVPDNSRSQTMVTERNTLVLDAYNANPSSMEAALSHFGEIAGENKVVILGDMKELGTYTTNEHRRILENVLRHPYSQIILIGNEFADAARTVCDPVRHGIISFEQVDQAADYLKKNLLSEKIILIKGSRAMQLERLIPYL